MELLLGWRRLVLLGCLMVIGLSGCSTTSVPRKFVVQAERGVTLTALKAKPDAYHGKVVILGGVIVEKRVQEGLVWLLMKNRPVDDDFVPHMVVSMDSPEAGFFWVAVHPEGLPKGYEGWARVTVVGQVSDQAHPHLGSGHGSSDTVLAGMFLRGWGSGWGGYGMHEEAWESTRSVNAMMSAPRTILRTGQGQ